MEIESIKKFNLQDGDIICLPREEVSDNEVDSIARVLTNVFPKKCILLAIFSKGCIEGMKIINVKEIKDGN